MRQKIFLACILLSACGAEDSEKTEDSGVGVPASVITDVELKPGPLRAFDAATLKSKMEAGGEGSYKANEADDDDEEEENCSDKKFKELLIEAKDDTLRVTGEIDLSDCLMESYEESFEGATLDKLEVSYTVQLAAYIRCSGQDLSVYNGKSFSEIDQIDECNKSSEVSSLSEFRTENSTSGQIENFDHGGTDVTYIYNVDNLQISTTRTTSGMPCTGIMKDGVISWANGCVITERKIDTTNTTGVEGETKDDPNVGKSTYEQLVYTDIEENADSTSTWYSGGSFAVTYNDWEGTVTYASATSEPIFEMKKGSETVTGTIKDEVEDEDDAQTLGFTSLKRDIMATWRSH